LFALALVTKAACSALQPASATHAATAAAATRPRTAR
jgi:hypothetical protein